MDVFIRFDMNRQIWNLVLGNSQLGTCFCTWLGQSGSNYVFPAAGFHLQGADKTWDEENCFSPPKQFQADKCVACPIWEKLQQKFSFTPSLCEPAAQPSAIGGTNRKTLFFEAVVPSCFARDPQPGASSLVHGIDWMFQNLGSIHPIVFQWFWQSTSTVERTQHESAIFFGSNFQDRNTRVPKQWQTCIYSNPKSKPTREASQLPSEGQKEYLFPTACV